MRRLEKQAAIRTRVRAGEDIGHRREKYLAEEQWMVYCPRLSLFSFSGASSILVDGNCKDVLPASPPDGHLYLDSVFGAREFLHAMVKPPPSTPSLDRFRLRTLHHSPYQKAPVSPLQDTVQAPSE